MKLVPLLLLLASCASQPLPTPEIPTVPPVVVTPPVVVVPPVIIIPPVEPPKVTIAAITDIAANSSCAKYKWKDRGVAPKSYIKGMAVMFAKEVCKPGLASTTTYYRPGAGRDGLEHYGKTPDAITSFSILIGAGMRESSGKYCTGKDASASNSSSDTAEGGMFQTSFNAIKASTAHPDLMVIFNKYKAGGVNCVELFKEGVSCSSADAKNYGTGDGYLFQKLSKDCPALSAEIAANTLRSLYKHYGPLINRAAEDRQECRDMLTAVEIQVKARPELCQSL